VPGEHLHPKESHPAAQFPSSTAGLVGFLASEIKPRETAPAFKEDERTFTGDMKGNAPTVLHQFNEELPRFLSKQHSVDPDHAALNLGRTKQQISFVTF
jgi:hypothetical protein